MTPPHQEEQESTTNAHHPSGDPHSNGDSHRQEQQQKLHRNLIFLDIDGVLNRTKCATHIRLDEDLVCNFKTLLDETNADIVLSTFWRHYREYISYILDSGYKIPSKRIIGSTPGYNRSMTSKRKSSDDKEYTHRAHEIRTWLQRHTPHLYHGSIVDDNVVNEVEDGNDNDDHEQFHYENFVIIDDRESAAKGDVYLQEHFVYCNTQHGLTFEKVQEAISILNSTNNKDERMGLINNI